MATTHAQVPEPAHGQVWIKVNAPVDAMIRGVVERLNDVPELETIESCQGRGGKPAVVSFWLGDDWQRLTAFVFGDLAPVLVAIPGQIRLSVETSHGNRPRCRLQFDLGVVSHVEAALDSL